MKNRGLDVEVLKAESGKIWVRKSTKGKGCAKTHAKSREGLGVLIEARKHSGLSVLEEAKGFQCWDLEETSSKITEDRKQQQ